MTFFFDFETRSLLDLSERGLDNYARHPSTQVLLMAYAFDNGPVQLWQAHQGPMPVDAQRAILNPFIRKAAWNASFEHAILKHVLGISVPHEQSIDIMVCARYLSLPGKLEECGPRIGLPEVLQKLEEGKRLIKKFCEPWETDKKKKLFDMGLPFRDHRSDPEDWKLFCDYCRQDVIAEREIYRRMWNFPLPSTEHLGWRLDQRINERGLPTSLNFVTNALSMAEKYREEKLLSRLTELTGLENTNSRNQVLDWVKTRGYSFGSLRKEFVTLALNAKDSKLTPEGREVLTLRQEAGRNSYRKFETIKNHISNDGRLRHQFLFLRAARNGRWAGQGVQVQNLVRPSKEVEKNYKRAVELIETNNYPTVITEFGSVINTVTSCVRSSFQAPPGYRAVVCDLSAIENRGLGWISGCDAILDVFRQGRDPYIDFGTKMYKIPYETITKAQRQISKPAVLGAGYGLSGGEETVNKYGDTVKTGLWGYAETMGVIMTREEAHLAVKVFRASYPEVVNFWHELDHAATLVLAEGGQAHIGRIHFDVQNLGEMPVMRIQLPSGRHLHYLNARMETRTLRGRGGDEYEKLAIVYDGIGHGAGMIQEGWGPVYTWGGKLTENIVQALSRDILLHGMFLAEQTGFEIVGHFHDEIFALVPETSSLGLADLRARMSDVPTWADGLPLTADGYEGRYYRKG